MRSPDPEPATDSDFEDIDRAPGEHPQLSRPIRGRDELKQLVEKNGKAELGQVEVEPASLEHTLIDRTVRKDSRLLRNHIDPSVLFAVSCLLR